MQAGQGRPPTPPLSGAVSCSCPSPADYGRNGLVHLSTPPPKSVVYAIQLNRLIVKHSWAFRFQTLTPGNCVVHSGKTLLHPSRAEWVAEGWGYYKIMVSILLDA